MQETKNEDTSINVQEINKKNIATENSSLKTDRNNKNEFSDKKSCFMKHRLLIILSIIIAAILIIISLIITILVIQKKQEKIIVDIKREINQIDYYRSTKKQRIYFENVKSSNNENLRNLEDEIYENSKETTINFLTSINTYDVKKYFNGTTIYKSFIIIKELSYLNENGNDEKILSFNFDEEINESNENIEEINNIPLIKVEFYRNGTIINEFIPKNLNKTFLDLLEYSKEKLIPLVSESLYKNNNLRVLSEDYDKLSYKKENDIVILKREINTKINNNGNIIKDSINEGNMETKIINGTIKNIELKSRVSLSTNDTHEENDENENNVYFKLPYHKISSDVYENFIFIKSDINEKITNNLKNLIKKCSLVDKNKLDEEEEVKEENNKENLEDKLRRLSSNSLFKDNYQELTILKNEFLGANIRIYLRIESYLNLEQLVITLYFEYNSKNYILFQDNRYLKIVDAQEKIINNLIAYKKQVNNFANNFLNLMNEKLIPLYGDIYEKAINYTNETLKIFPIIDQIQKNVENHEESEEQNISQIIEIIDSLEPFSLNDLDSEVNQFTKNIQNYFTNKTLSIVNYTNPIYEFNKLNSDFEKDIPTLSSNAVKFFESKNENLIEIQKELEVQINNIIYFRNLTQNNFVSGNPYIDSVLQDFDRISYEFYLLINYFNNLKIKITQELSGEAIFEGINNRTIINKVESNIIDDYNKNLNQIKNHLNQKFIKLNKEFDKIQNIINKLKNIYNNIIPNAKSSTYNSMINDWKKILKSMPKIVFANIGKNSNNKSLFKIKIGAFGVGFTIESKLQQFLFNIKIDLTYKPEDLSCSLNVEVKSGLEISIGGSVDALVVGGGAEAYISFGNFGYQYTPILDFYNYENRINTYSYFKVPQLGFRVYFYYYTIVIKCKVFICYPWVDKRTEYLVDIHTPSVIYDKRDTKKIEIYDKNKILEKEKMNKELMENNKNKIDSL